jgi:hypothetical protein
LILEGLSNGTIDLAYLAATDMLNAMNERSATLLLAGEIHVEDLVQELLGDAQGETLSVRGRSQGQACRIPSKTTTSGYVIPL